jgi:hypothetical protein
MTDQSRTTVWSNGLGTQSAAVAVLIAAGQLPAPAIAITADTSRERPESWDYANAYIFPLLRKLGVQIEIASHKLATVDLYGKNGDLLIPAFTAGGKGKLPTLCSNEWKRRVVMRHLRQLGYGPDQAVELWLGITRDEAHRMKTSDVQWMSHRYPLAMELRMSKHDAIAVVERFGWPTPPGSYCYMCPHMRDNEWREIRANPVAWLQAIHADQQITASHGLYVHRSGVPLMNAEIDTEKPAAWFDGCDSGICEF